MLHKNGADFCNRVSHSTRDAINVYRVKFSRFEKVVQAQRGLLDRDLAQNRKSKKSICYNAVTVDQGSGCLKIWRET
jgi:hypothetical protein